MCPYNRGLVSDNNFFHLSMSYCSAHSVYNSGAVCALVMSFGCPVLIQWPMGPSLSDDFSDPLTHSLVGIGQKSGGGASLVVTIEKRIRSKPSSFSYDLPCCEERKRNSSHYVASFDVESLGLGLALDDSKSQITIQWCSSHCFCSNYRHNSCFVLVLTESIHGAYARQRRRSSIGRAILRWNYP